MRPRQVIAIALLAAAGAARAQVDLNVISAVDVRDQGSSVVLTVRGSKPPNFTTFSMADPPRFVVDLSEARFQGVAEDIPVNDGTILVVKNLSYGADATSISRVMIAFSVDVDPPEVQAVGNDLVVRVDKPASGAPVARVDDGAAREAERARAEAQAKAEAEARAQEEAEARARAAVEAELRAQAQAREREAAEAARREAEARASAEAQQRSAEEARREEERRAEEERERQQQQAAAAARAEEERRLAADREESDRRARAEARAAADAEGRRKEEEARAALEADRIAREEARRRQAEEARAAEEAERQRREEERLARAAAARTDQLSAVAPATQLREVGFQQMPGASRVYVRTSATPQFTIQDVGDNTIRVEIQNTRVTRRNDTRFLDTSFFPSAVAMISPSSRGGNYVLDIKLRERVPFQQKIEGDMLAIDFERPAAAERPPAAEAPGEAPPGEAPPEDGPDGGEEPPAR